jgi:predicted transcriptional regulator
MLPDLDIIKVLRKKSNLTQKELSKLCGLSQSYINKIENLSAEPPYSVAKKLIELLRKYKGEYEGLNAKKLMTPIRTISPQKTLKDAVIMMDSINVSQLPVADNGVILGSITKKSIPLLIKNGVKNIESQPIGNIMEPPFPLIPDNSDISLISTLLEYNEAVILLNFGKLSGIITKSDLMKVLK